MDRLKDMKAKWSANKPKYAACRKEVKVKGLAGDDRMVLHRGLHGQVLSPRRLIGRVDEGHDAACPLNAH